MMLRCYLVGGVVTGLCRVAPVAAAIFASDGFNYRIGELDGQHGGIGFSQPWQAETEFTLDVVRPERPLRYLVPGGGLINGGTRSLSLANRSGGAVLKDEPMALSRSFTEAFTGDDLYFSFLYRYSDGLVNDNDFAAWWFNDFKGPVIGLKGNGGNGGQTEDLAARVGAFFAPPRQVYAPDVDISHDAGTIGRDFFVVGNLSRANHTENLNDYDRFSLWINPTIDDVATPDAVAVGVRGESLTEEIEVLGMRALSLEPGDGMLWDELRIGTTWNDVLAPLGRQSLDGDFNQDDTLSVADVDILCSEVASGADSSVYDFTGDGAVSVDDVNSLLDAANLVGGDLDSSGTVQFGDFAILASGFQQSDVTWTDGDVNCDGHVQLADFVILAESFGRAVPVPATHVPEPTRMPTGIVALLTLLCTIRVARRWVSPSIAKKL